ncbi:MAG: malto-oligosyltrehalose trehalohydrolase [Bryobacteraceae bacterium]
MTYWEAELGASVIGHTTRFCVWAPEIQLVELAIETPGEAKALHAMTRSADGFHVATLPGISDGALYRFRLDGSGPFPDPASRFQPEGVHGPSRVVDWERFPWTDAGWSGVPLHDVVLYELHIGTFTPEGTFAAAAGRLPYLKELGVTAVELMPVGDFAGNRNWGYDSVAPFAPARCYGSPDDLRNFVDQAHALGLAVHLDVIYNHLGPDGAYQSCFSPYYYSTTHQSPWGAGINYDGPRSEPVRDYAIKNALRWIHEYHFDGLRLDATHAIVDDGPRHIIASLASAVCHSLKDGERQVAVVAEDDRNLSSMLRPESVGGWGLDGAWSDDFHHQMRRALAGDSDGYFQDFDGTTNSIAATARQGWFYTGQHAPYFGLPRGTDPTGIASSHFVFFLQNHDQIGNRAFGDRIHHKIGQAEWRAASTLLLLLPETPLLFMGQEWAATTPFLYFTDHNEELGKLVTEGRRKEFGRFAAFADPAARASIPDPQDAETFRKSRLLWKETLDEPHASVSRLYRRLLALRKTLAPTLDSPAVSAVSADSILLRRTGSDGAALWILIRLRNDGREMMPGLPPDGSGAELVLTTEDTPFTTDSQLPLIETAGGVAVTFTRPGAVIFRVPNPEGGRE